MAKVSLSWLILIYILCISSLHFQAGARSYRPQSFVEVSCRRTLYPDLCVRSLSGCTRKGQQNLQELARVALLVSLTKAQYTQAYVLEVARDIKSLNNSKDYQAVQDCLSQIHESVEHLSHSVRELRRMTTVEDNQGDVIWSISNLETWLSSALTDANSCMNEFSGKDGRGGKLKANLKARLLNLAQVSSNALALFHGFAARYRVSTNKP